MNEENKLTPREKYLSLPKPAKFFWDFVSLFGTLGGGLAICALSFALSLRFGLVMAANLVALTIICNTVKYFYFRARPENDAKIRPTINFHVLDVRKYLSLKNGFKNALAAFRFVDAGSFPSIHSARSLNQAVLLAWFFQNDPPVGAAIIVFALVVGISRVVKAKHWPSDVAVGFVVGALAAVISAETLKNFILG